ncbi:hypothetical protein [Jeotgalicoccus sp. S0W5]|uniref:hypothetical protein n=1 Tax=Jeotgalicoccus sp. S0W5 TaxID=2527874 RepID=UPI001415145E|nr:hypothetical protein [Jeotgalicoccus sp. S0W5]
MGFFEFIFFTALVLTIGGVSIPLYAMRRGYNQSDVKLRIKEMEERRKLEEIKQENYVLENKSMELELEKLKKERKERETKALEDKNKRWLIEETRGEEKHENTN